MGKKKCNLDECFFELDSLEQYIKGCIRGDLDTDGKMDSDLLLLLVRAAKEKLIYYQGKYKFKVDEKDNFYVSDMPDFFFKAFTGESREDATNRVIGDWQEKTRKEIEAES